MRAVVLAVLALAGSAHAGVTFVGNVAVGSAELAAVIDAPYDAKGQIDHDVLERDVLLIQGHYWDRGYVQVKVKEPAITGSEIAIEIEEGPVFAMGEVTIKGVSVMTSARLAGRLAIKGGQTFSRSLIAKDRETLVNYFEELGYAYANVLPLTKVDLTQHAIALVFEIEQGKRVTIEKVVLVNATKLPDAALRKVLKVSAGDAFRPSRLEATKLALKVAGVPDVALSTKAGSSDTQVIVTFEAQTDN